MSQFYEMIRHTRSYANQINKICAPLFRSFGFNSLFYHSISNDGYGTSFGNHIESFEYYFDQHLYRFNPYARHPDLFQSSYFLIPSIKDVHYQKANQIEVEKFDIHYQIVILHKNAKSCEGFSFGFSKKESDKTSFNYLSDLPLLQCFIRYFKQEAQPILKHIMQDQLNLTDFIGDQFYSKPHAIAALDKQKKIEFIKQIGVIFSVSEINLTTREKDCLRLLLQGNSASQIAQVLKLSKRTVEHYLENVKLKSNCDSKLEILEKFKAIESLGLLEI